MRIPRRLKSARDDRNKRLSARLKACPELAEGSCPDTKRSLTEFFQQTARPNHAVILSGGSSATRTNRSRRTPILGNDSSLVGVLRLGLKSSLRMTPLQIPGEGVLHPSPNTATLELL